jgi:hypothetical protein
VKITVAPSTFTMVQFDRARIAELAGDTARCAGLAPDIELHLDVDEASMLQRVRVVELAAPVVTISVQGGAFEDRRRRRQLSDDAVRGALAPVLYRVRDRLDPEFGAAPADGDLDLLHATAWDAYAIGRAARAGLPAHRGLRQYHFRNRHGFNDTADAVFDRLWTATALTWPDIERACADTEQARSG